MYGVDCPDSCVSGSAHEWVCKSEPESARLRPLLFSRRRLGRFRIKHITHVNHHPLVIRLCGKVCSNDAPLGLQIAFSTPACMAVA